MNKNIPAIVLTAAILTHELQTKPDKRAQVHLPHAEEVFLPGGVGQQAVHATATASINRVGVKAL